ncbi:MAG: DUF488 domain-containing protein [Chloroflexi bacterium]|nr:DUF488 domain-containing protein [Chloroflexota bacterium]
MKNNGRNNGQGNGHGPPELILTIGHSTNTVRDFIQRLKMNGVTKLIDVRAIPRSRSNPPFNSETLPAILAAHKMGYLHMGGLGGLRYCRRGPSNQGWLNVTFMGFALYMQSPEFEVNLEALIKLAKLDQLALMCGEAMPWQCHRAMIADALMVRGIRVEHMVNHSGRRGHVLTPWAMVSGTKISYPLTTVGKERQLVGV